MVLRMKEKLKESKFVLMGEEQRKEAAEYYAEYNAKLHDAKLHDAKAGKSFGGVARTELNHLNVLRADLNHVFFMHCVGDALRDIHKDYWISTLEPSLDADGKIFYESGKAVAVGISNEQWRKKIASFADEESEYYSEEANLQEVCLFYFWRVAKGLWDMNFICRDSSIKRDNVVSKFHPKYQAPVFKIERSGAREVGGFFDGTGNTQKIVSCLGLHGKYVETGMTFVKMGYSYGQKGMYFPVAEFRSGFRKDEDVKQEFATPVAVVKLKEEKRTL